MATNDTVTTALSGCDFKLAADLVADCSKSSVSGLRNNGYIINFDDIDRDSCTRDASNPCILTSLVLKAGKKAHRMYIPGNTPFAGTATTLVKSTYKSKYTKTVPLVVLDNGPEVVKDIIHPLANGKFVIVLENSYSGAGGKNTFEVYGFEQGMSATAMAADKYAEETDGGWSATLEETGAPSAGIYLFNESVTTTRAALASLVAGS